MQLYSARACPYAQRVRALVKHLGIGCEIREVDLDDRDPEFLKLSPTGRVPLLVDGRTKLYESMVINEYLADEHGLAEAWHGSAAVRARERLMMLQWDHVLVPAFLESIRTGSPLDAGVHRRVSAELDEMVRTLLAIEHRGANLLAFHCAPFWARMDWLRSRSPVPELVDERLRLRGWLDEAVALPAVQATLPERDETVRAFDRGVPR